MWSFLWFSLAHRAWHLVVMQDFWHALLHVERATSLLLNLAICLRYMKTWNYNRTDTMPISYTIIMIRSAGAKFPPEHSGIWYWRHSVWNRCDSVAVAELLQLYVSSHTWLTWLMQSSLQQPVEHDTVVAVFLYGLLLVYLSLSLSLILIPQKAVYYLTCPLDT